MSQTNNPTRRSHKEEDRQSVQSVTTPPAESASVRDLAIIACGLDVVGVALLLLFVLFAPRLVATDILDRFFYIVSIVWGLVSALVLFGVMKSYAHVTHKSMGWAIELGGPAAFAALVVVDAFWVFPRTDTFDLTIRPHAPGKQLITSGRIRLEIGNSAPTSSVNADGEADFKGIPHKYRGAKVRVLPQVDGYVQEYQEIILDKDAVDLSLVNAPGPETTLRGRLTPAPRMGQIVKVLVEGEDAESVPDSYGRFQTVVHKKLGERVGLDVCANGRSIYNNYISVDDDEIEIPVHKPGFVCSSTK